MKPRFTIAALYRFAPVEDCAELQAALRRLCAANGIRGTLLIAPEGINGTVAGSQAAISSLLATLAADPRFAGIEAKLSFAESNPFARLKVRLKKEIVTLGVPGVDARADAGTRIEPARWNELIARPDVVVIDVRNEYETAIGTFEGAIAPGTMNFRDFPAWFEANRGRFGSAPKFGMFCTGGIRCEKATAYVKGLGYGDVFHLEGGILNYLEKVPESESLWHGQCFVFDERVSVGHDLKPGPYELCHACRMPITPADKASPQYVAEVSCPRCHGKIAADKQAALAERRKQVDLARARGERHVGADLGVAKTRKHSRRGSPEPGRQAR